VISAGQAGACPGPDAGHPLQRAGHYHASEAKLLAGSLMQYVTLGIVVAGLSLVCGQIWLRRRRVTPLRREIRARDITFRAALDRVYVIEPGTSPGSDFEVPISSPVELIVRGDAFEVSNARPLGRVMGLEYFFRARETSVELNRPIPRIYGMDTPPRIIVRGWQGGRKIQLTIRQKNDLLEIWNALTAAGAVPDIAWITPRNA